MVFLCRVVVSGHGVFVSGCGVWSWCLVMVSVKLGCLVMVSWYMVVVSWCLWSWCLCLVMVSGHGVLVYGRGVLVSGHGVLAVSYTHLRAHETG